MKNYCGKCGSKINQKTGICPNCDIKQEVKMHKKKGDARKRLLCIFLLLTGIGIGVGIVGSLSYFGRIDIPVVSDWIDENERLENFIEEKLLFIVEGKKNSDKVIPAAGEAEKNEEIEEKVEEEFSTAQNEQKEIKSGSQEDEEKNLDESKKTNQNSISTQLIRKNYYDNAGKIIYYETYVYYDNGLLCSTTMHSVEYYDNGDSYPVNIYTMLSQ